ncbi:hypothetical protein ISF_01378 [Cordyceps fumosorosea ARSEF 2679]|uniref:Uncharacterized protein n=1 Tax=Cordyceps fumosorosea (strain ARSEF 2679) TaxID=1081104 RepID=A0A168D8Z7_CORFA|nr:hypothetical protein ISF_01378 [Cordyceps fumosorosea ARSEF 2679]OAA72305.1 hypothetical protein ISF_01378 [Cordyceps fumosorosea ARSEF 2679]
MDTESTANQIPPVAHRPRPGRLETRRAAARVSNGRQHTRNRYYHGELDNDVEIARSDIPLPGEGNYRRCPSLERQEAFYHASTAKSNPRVRRPSFSEDAQVARLYQKGLLYNDGEAAGGSLELNSIRHSEPTYVVRPAKRARKNGKQGRRNGQTYSLEPPLALNLSFSDIGDDEAIARYFFASQQASPEDIIQHASSQDSVPPLRVIYELAGSQGSVDVDASQPPDLILDSEEFDLLSDSEMYDTPTSTQDFAADPSSAWVMVGNDL